MQSGNSIVAEIHIHTHTQTYIHRHIHIHTYTYIGQTSWIEELRTRLTQSDNAIVAEIGLDKKWTPPGCDDVQYAAQLEVFKVQMQVCVCVCVKKN
jgi:Tat protein secretion system quality control protein TatD with DNase activity